MTDANSMPPGAAAALATHNGRDWRRIALRLVAVTMAYNVIEAVVALTAGVRAGSLALVGFGFDSLIELAAASALLWRLEVEARGADPGRVQRAEHRVHRFVGATFFVLTAYVLAQGAYTLYTREAAAESPLGIALAIASLTIMPVVALLKMRAAREVGSAALRAEAKETLACSYLSLTLLIGLGGNALWGLWWADPVAALLMVPWLVKEGREGLRGEGCEHCGEDDD
jgi:divalent metal cation (Fe/Co/Zn/Cd) transporter